MHAYMRRWIFAKSSCFEKLAMKEQEVLECQIQLWYPRFRSVSIKTLFLPLPQSFVSYLLEDGLFLPASSDAIPSRIHIAFPELQAEDYHHWTEEDQQEDEPQVPSFPELEDSVRTAIEKLGGVVFPKLNWSAPKDTAWISSSGSLKCKNFGEIVLLLKASDTLVHDLSHAFDSCEDQSIDRPPSFVLALRKWCDLRPEMEFRGFVRGGFLVGICQREVTGFYPALVGREEALESVIFQFFSEVLSERFVLEDYTFDIYVTKEWSVKLIDFNPWGAFTLPLLFSWDELEESYTRFAALLDRLLKNVEFKDAGLQTDSTTAIYNLIPDLEEILSLQGDRETGYSVKEAHEDVQRKQLLLESEVGNINGMQGQEAERRMEDNHSKQMLCSGDCSDSFGNLGQYMGAANCLDSFGSSGDHRSEAAASKKMPLGTKIGELLHSRKAFNIQLRECGYRAQFRVVKSGGHVQTNLRMGGGVPYDYVNMGPGSAWEEFLKKANEELQQQTRGTAAGG